MSARKIATWHDAGLIDAAFLIGVGIAPRLETLFRGVERMVEIRRGGMSDPADRLAGCGIEHFRIVAPAARQCLAADEKVTVVHA